MKSLIVEDDPVSRYLMGSILSPFGPVKTAVDGEEGVQMYLLAFEEGVPFDVVMLDIMLPKLDGKNVLERIREIESSETVVEHGRTKIIMTTALSHSDETILHYRDYYDGYIEKPLDREIVVCELRKMGFDVGY